MRFIALNNEILRECDCRETVRVRGTVYWLRTFGNDFNFCGDSISPLLFNTNQHAVVNLWPEIRRKLD